MKRSILTFATFAILTNLCAQPTFKIGWNTFQTGTITHVFIYNYSASDTSKLALSDSMKVMTTPDSLVSVTIDYPFHDKSIYKTANFLNAKKQLVKSEEYKDEALTASNEWKYDDKNRKIFHLEENKLTGNSYRKTYDYTTDKKTGELVITESSYYNGKIEFYTKSYYDKNNVKYKEMRLNDNNKDIIHIESYTYGENGKVKERSVYFPEFKVTKKFEERDGSLLPKCFRVLPMNTLEKPTLVNRVGYIKRVLTRNQLILTDKDCEDFEYKFTNGTNCEIFVCTTKVNNGRLVKFRFKDKL